jgi:uncharacterized membrane protein YdjX (TVP38/TMEM64 family)
VRGKPVALALVAAVAAWSIWSYATGGLIATLVSEPASGTALDAVRDYVLGWGYLAPFVYVVIVTVEVVVAPIPGAILYAPGGAIFGGLIGGSLSLIGNVIGAAIACWLGATFGADWVAGRTEAGRLAPIRERLQARGGWLVFVLRVNPFTSSDLVSYAAGVAGVPVRHVALGTLAGMAPLCYAQAYLAATLFELLPGSPFVLMAVALVVTVAVMWLALRTGR